MDQARLFISLPLEGGLTRDIHKGFESLDLPWEKLKVVEPDNMHLTLKFLGPTPIDKIPDIISTLDKIKLSEDSIELVTDKAQIFNEKQPRVLSIALQANKTLQELFDKIDQALFDAGLAHKEVRRFKPHLTMARVKQSATMDEFKDWQNFKINKIFNLSFFVLMESNLSKQGPHYTTLQSFDL
jgi:RNA 2',3'-cyclic 3'-phosphodiesterase